MQKGQIDSPPPYNYQPPAPGAVPPEPLQPGYGAGAMPPPQAGQVHQAQPGAFLPPQPHIVQQPGVTTVVVASQVPMYGPHPAQVSCMKCGAQVMTETKTAAGLLTWLVCGGLALIGCWIGCCLIPFCIDDCQDIEHWCPNCKQHLGTYKRLN